MTRAQGTTGRRTPATVPVPELSLGEWVCLTLVRAGASHGWAVHKELEPPAVIGSVWSLSRQLTYRALDQLTKKGLLVRSGTAPGRGQGRLLLALTPAGEAATAAWLERPVAHIRDVRTEGLVKLLLRQRLGFDNAPFLRHQQAVLQPIIDAILAPETAGDDQPGELPDLLRREQARATQRFLQVALRATAGDEPGAPSVSRPPSWSAGTELHGTIDEVSVSELVCEVRVALAGGQQATALVPADAFARLGLGPGDPAVVVVHPSQVVVARQPR